MAERNAAIVDYQARAAEYAVGDVVHPFISGNSDLAGRVVAVYPAIGMLDVEWPHGSERVPVEDLIRLNPEELDAVPPKSDNVPGGAETVIGKKAARRVAEAFVRKALYWVAPDRKYRASSEEVTSGQFHCPKCRKSILQGASYKRESGQSIRLLACPECSFLIRKCDLIGHPENEDAGTLVVADDPYFGDKALRELVLREMGPAGPNQGGVRRNREGGFILRVTGFWHFPSRDHVVKILGPNGSVGGALARLGYHAVMGPTEGKAHEARNRSDLNWIEWPFTIEKVAG